MGYLCEREMHLVGPNGVRSLRWQDGGRCMQTVRSQLVWLRCKCGTAIVNIGDSNHFRREMPNWMNKLCGMSGAQMKAAWKSEHLRVRVLFAICDLRARHVFYESRSSGIERKFVGKFQLKLNI